jgi:hypothetical protein
MKAALSFLLQLPLLTGASAQTPQADRIDVTGFGIYTGTRTSTLAAPETTLGTVSGLDDIRHAQNTRTIRAQLGVSFGFRYNVISSQNGAVVPLHIVVIYPSPGLVNPATQQTRVRDEVDSDQRVGQSLFLGYTFDHDWELYPGVWTFQIWYQGRELAEQSFNVVKQ